MLRVPYWSLSPVTGANELEQRKAEAVAAEWAVYERLRQMVEAKVASLGSGTSIEQAD